MDILSGLAESAVTLDIGKLEINFAVKARAEGGSFIEPFPAFQIGNFPAHGFQTGCWLIRGDDLKPFSNEVVK
jgi:hypothetical protein